MAIILAILTVISLLLTLWQWVVTWRFPLHQRIGDKSYAPQITLLKPLKGLDDKTLDCLKSWFTQDYPAPVQILFGVASREDPVCPVVNNLIQAYPLQNAQLVVCGESLGANAKVSTLIQLARLAKNEVIVVSDADVFVAPDFLINVAAPLRDPGVGLVNCFYRMSHPVTLAMCWEAIATNADFWSQVLQGRSLQSLDFALGAVMATRQEQLKKIGGFAVLADYLADDFQLGNRIVRSGSQIALSPMVVDCLSAPMNWREAWAHQLRWARTIRVCKPLPYAFSLLSNATFWPLLLLAVQPSRWSLAALFFCMSVRIATALALLKRLTPDEPAVRFCWLVPIKDLLQFALWVSAFFGNSIAWRGRRFQLQQDGRLVPQ